MVLGIGPTIWSILTFEQNVFESVFCKQIVALPSFPAHSHTHTHIHTDVDLLTYIQMMDLTNPIEESTLPPTNSISVP